METANAIVTDKSILFKSFLDSLRDGQVKIWEDGGHAWLQVPRSFITAEMGISGYSYQDSHSVYLEEDCDMERFFNTLPSWAWKEVKDRIPVQRHHGDSPVRSKPQYKAGITEGRAYAE